jgi:hypothetical protein
MKDSKGNVIGKGMKVRVVDPVVTLWYESGATGTVLEINGGCGSDLVLVGFTSGEFDNTQGVWQSYPAGNWWVTEKELEVIPKTFFEIIRAWF